MEVVPMEEFAQTIYQMNKKMRLKDDEIESLEKKMEHLEELMFRLKKEMQMKDDEIESLKRNNEELEYELKK